MYGTCGRIDNKADFDFDFDFDLPGLWRKITQWSKVLFSDESKFCISFGNKVPGSGGRVERHRIHVA